MSRNLPKQPLQRHEFRIGIICALSHEANMVNMAFDKSWEKGNIRYGQATRDLNTYTTGAIGNHNVVLAYCPAAGNNNATQVACSMLSSFSGVEIVFVVGICGVMPFNEHLGRREEILLGDCIISTGVVQLDLGREGPAGFKRKDGLDGLGRPAAQIRGLLAKLQANRFALTQETIAHLQALQARDPAGTTYPGALYDRLYKSSYDHTHHQPSEHCNQCDVQLGICNKSCRDLGCDDQYLEYRIRLDCNKLDYNSSPRIHFGYIGSSNKVLKSATVRDSLAKADNVIAFEMESAGIWDVCPTIVIKAACDYADSHKNKDWQQYAAAVAAAGLKSFLYNFDLPDKVDSIGSVTSDQAAICEADNSVRNYYKTGNRLQIERLSGEKLSLDRCYINLAMVDRSDKQQHTRGSSPFSLRARLKLDASDIGKHVLLEDLFESKGLADGTTAVPRRIFIQGRAGVGKSTLCKKIVHEFLENGLANSLFDRLLWIPLRRLKSKEKEYEWLDLVQDAHSFIDQTWKQVRETYSLKFYDSAFLGRTLLLFDGLDEISWKEGDKMYDFLQGILNESPNVIITSRPQANCLDMRSFHLELETIGFLPEQIDTYISHCVPKLRTISEMQSFLVTKPLIKDLLRIPIQLDAFCYVWTLTESLNRKDTNELADSRRDSINTMTTLYQSISLELCRRDIARLGLINRPHELMEFEINKVLETEVKLVKELAFQGLVNGITEYNPKHQDKIGAFLAHNGAVLPTPYRPILERTSFLRCSDLEQSQRNYHFIHLTFQEFFAAKHFAEHWQKRTTLVCLQLIAPGTRQEMDPLDFLRKEKYNPRYNIFWRFVTGLIQMQSEEQNHLGHNDNDIVTFFDLLHDKPIDLLRYGQRQLAMHCLSELADSDKQVILDLRQRQEYLLRIQVVQEYRTTRSYRSIKRTLQEDEIPEGVMRSLLRSFLQHERDLPCKEAIEILTLRKFLEVKTLAIVPEFLSNTFSLDIRLTACRLIFKHCTKGQEEMLARAVQDYHALTKDSDKSVRRKAAVALYSSTPVPEEAVNALIALLKDGDDTVRSQAGLTLEYRQNLSHGSLITLLSMLQDEDYRARTAALYVLSHMKSLPEEAIIALIVLLHDEVDEVRRSAIYTLSNVEPLSEEAIVAVTALLQDQDHEIRRYAASAFAKIKPVPEQVVVALTALLQDECDQVRVSAADAHWNINPLPKQAVVPLIALLQDENYLVQSSAIRALGNIKPLPEQVVVALTRLLQDENDHVREAARRTLPVMEDNQPPQQDTISSLVARLKSEDFETQYSATVTLAESSLSRDTTVLLISMLKDKSVRHSVVKALSGSPFYEDVIPILISMFDSTDLDLRQSAASILSRWSLPEDVVMILVEKLKHADPDMRYAATTALRQQLSLSLENMTALIRTLKYDDSHEVYRILQQCRAWSHITNPDNRIWQDLYVFWLRNTSYIDVVCYEFENSLWLYESGVQYQLSSDPKRTQELVQFAQSTGSLPWPALSQMESEIEMEGSETEETEGEEIEIESSDEEIEMERSAKRIRYW